MRKINSFHKYSVQLCFSYRNLFSFPNFRYDSQSTKNVPNTFVMPDTDNDKDRFGLYAQYEHAIYQRATLTFTFKEIRMYIRYGTLILRVDYNVLINYFEIASNMKREVNRRIRFCHRHVFQGHFKKI